MAGDLSERIGPKGTWWDWDHAKLALEWLFCSGRVTARRRGNDFARLYDLPERMLPAAGSLDPPRARARRPQGAARAGRPAPRRGHARDLADYHRQSTTPCQPLVAELVEEGRLVPVTVEGWARQAYLAPRGPPAPPGAGAGRCSRPFDSLVWDATGGRAAVRLPLPDRDLHAGAEAGLGYYVLPFLLGDELVGRVDLKADRARPAAGRGARGSSRASRTPWPPELAEELRAMAGWLGLERVVVVDRGDLAPALADCLKASPW